MMLETFPVGPLGCNCSIIACERSKEAVVVDPGGDVDRIVACLEESGLSLKHIVHTHAHIDHVLGTAELHERCGGAVCLHEGDRFLYENLAMQGRMLGLPTSEVTAIERGLEDNESVAFGDGFLLVLHTPGHTPGSVSFVLRRQNDSGSAEEQVLLSGDTLFRRGVGRTDLWGGDSDQLMGSIRTRLLSLDDDTRVIPGHGAETRIGEERRANPFLAF
jgi:hydroxyacylglutathione hydrolase